MYGANNRVTAESNINFAFQFISDITRITINQQCNNVNTIVIQNNKKITRAVGRLVNGDLITTIQLGQSSLSIHSHCYSHLHKSEIFGV